MPQRVSTPWFSAWDTSRSMLTCWDCLAALLVLGVLAFLAESTRGLTQAPSELGSSAQVSTPVSSEQTPNQACRLCCTRQLSRKAG
jgi:hypothetical protein